jgi:serine/threonine-protein kinase
VAIRLLRRGGRRDWEAVRTRFLTEARSLQVAHPSILQVRDFGEEDDTLYTVTELVVGRRLVEALNAEAPFAWSRTWRLADQLIDATTALHRRSALICGLNSGITWLTADDEGERLMVSTGGVSQVQELLASLSEDVLRGGELSDAELPYVPPEVLTGGPADTAADVFTIGVLSYEMATGNQPFAGRTLPELMGAMLAGKPRDPQELSPGLPARAAACLLRCLAVDPRARFASAGELRAAWHAAGSA